MKKNPELKKFFKHIDLAVTYIKYLAETEGAKVSVSRKRNGEISIVMNSGVSHKEELLYQIEKGRKLCQK